MFGCESLAAVRPSRLKRAPISVPLWWGLRILTATGRSRTSSLPRKTRAIPPAPISRLSTNLCVNLVMRLIIAVPAPQKAPLLSSSRRSSFHSPSSTTHTQVPETSLPPSVRFCLTVKPTLASSPDTSACGYRVKYTYQSVPSRSRSAHCSGDPTSACSLSERYAYEPSASRYDACRPHYPHGLPDARRGGRGAGGRGAYA